MKAGRVLLGFTPRLAFAALACGCAGQAGRSPATDHPERLYPRPPQTPWVVALGSLETSSTPSPAETSLSVFLFGEEPEPPATTVRPLALVMAGDDLLIADGPLRALFRFRRDRRAMEELPLPDRPRVPAALCLAPNGDLLMADPPGAAVLRFDPAGHLIGRLVRDGPFQPVGLAGVAGEIWVSNAATHAIEVFDAPSGRHQRTLGGHGSGPARFSLPMGMAVNSAGEVLVVDVLNHRVQVLSSAGEWVRDIGRAGDCVGCLGRPRQVAVGPDGTIFVTDAAFGRVQAFDGRGRPLLAFGEPDAGPGALLMPGGICISRERPGGGGGLPADFEPDYFVLVAEQMLDPGVRVYAWRSPAAEVRAAATPAARPHAGAGTVPRRAVAGPHWMPDRCNDCHANPSDAPASIPQEQVDSLCLSCHDGRKARAEAHPIARLASTNAVRTPADWPAPGGRIGCLTCHDIRRHCDPAARRPAINPSMLRGHDADRPGDYCVTCHTPDPASRFSPHEQLAADGSVREASCLYCHESSPGRPGDGMRRGEPRLRSPGSRTCLNCHPRHWDVSPLGHVDRPVTPEVIRRMNARVSAGTNPFRPGQVPGAPAPTAPAETGRPHPRRLPITGGLVTCYTCHNPHQRGLFPEASELGLWAAPREDAEVALRMDRMELCIECHRK